MNSPVLLVTDPGYRANPFGAYLGEILKTEGFMALDKAHLAQVDLPYLRRFPLVILAESRPDRHQLESFHQYVAAGGRLIAMRPDPLLADLFGLAFIGPRKEMLHQHVGVNPDCEIGQGIEPTSLQYHGPADEYLVQSASVIAWLYDSDTNPSPHPAVVLNHHGEGLAIAFTYDLARSVALTRQGNPNWACGPESCEDGDGQEGIRPVDSFLRQSGESWVNRARIPIPQADEQQRLLSNCLCALSEGVMPLPRLWYLPAGKRAVLVMTGDGDEVGYAAFEQVMRAVEEHGGHFTAYLHGLKGDPTRAEVEDWIARGHEVSIHVVDEDGHLRPTRATLTSAYADAVERFASLYGRAPGPSQRNHCLAWYGWIDGAEIALDHGLHVDFNFYHGRQWTLSDGRWVNGYMTGSGLPQRFVGEDGTVLDIFQVLTQWSDETHLYRQKLGTDGATRLVREMMDAAEEHYPTVFVANFHPGGWKARETEPWARNMMREAAGRGMPIWSGEELHRFVAARDSARFSNLAWDGSRLSFCLEAQDPPAPMAVMLPAHFGARPLLAIARDGTKAEFTTQTMAGREYAFVEAPEASHRFTATYSTDLTLPSRS